MLRDAALRAAPQHEVAAFGGDVVEQDDVAARLEIAVDLALGAVVLDLLAHDEAVDGAAVPAAPSWPGLTRPSILFVKTLAKNDGPAGQARG